MTMSFSSVRRSSGASLPSGMDLAIHAHTNSRSLTLQLKTAFKNEVNACFPSAVNDKKTDEVEAAPFINNLWRCEWTAAPSRPDSRDAPPFHQPPTTRVSCASPTTSTTRLFFRFKGCLFCFLAIDSADLIKQASTCTFMPSSGYLR